MNRSLSNLAKSDPQTRQQPRHQRKAEAVAVGADAGATPEVIGDAGALFRAGDAAHAAEVMAVLLDDPQRCAALRRAARDRIAREFSLTAMQAAFDRLVRSL